MKSSLFGELLRQWRVEILKLSLQEFVIKLTLSGFDYSTSAIARYERGERKPGGEFVAHLSLSFGLPEEVAIRWLQVLGIEYVTELIDSYEKLMLSKSNNV